METKSSNSSWVPTKKFFSDALLIASLTGVGYLSAFAYQFAYLQYFGIPVFFVDINLGSVLLTAAIGFLTLLGIGTCIDILLRDIKSKPLKILVVSLVALVMLFILFIPILGLYFDINNDIVFGIVFIALLVLVVGMVIYAAKSKNQAADKRNNLFSMAEISFGSFPVLFVAALIFFVAYSGGIGKMVAQGTKNYLVSNTSPALMIVGTYSGNLIGLEFSTSTKTFSKNITLISPDEIAKNNIIFTSEIIGPLKSQ